MEQNINQKIMFGGLCQSEKETIKQILGPKASKNDDGSDNTDKKVIKRGRPPKVSNIAHKAKPKTSLYLPPEKMHRLRVHCAEENIKMTDFIEKAIDAQIKSDLRKRKEITKDNMEDA